ncbi:MAG: CoA ester lyase [Pseudomonadota bacterium]
MRSVLFCPASNARALKKLRNLHCDAVIVDLEDAVGHVNKSDARSAARDAFENGFGKNQIAALRINASDSVEYCADIALAREIQPDAVVLPKAEHPHQIDTLVADLNLPVWLMIETAMGVANVGKLAAHKRVMALILGPNDLRVSLGAGEDVNRSALLYSIGASVAAARAHRKWVFDGVFNNFRDEVGFTAEAQQGKLLGFNGKTLIHPSQIEPANQIFGTLEAEILRAKRVISAFEAGDGNAVQLDGELIEELHVTAALDLLRKNGEL